MLLLSARCVAFHLCPEGRPVGANLTRQRVVTDKVRGYLVRPFSSASTSVLIMLVISRISSTPAEHDSGTSIHFARETSSPFPSETSVTVIGLCAYGALRGENKSFVHELTGTSGFHRDTIHELTLAQSQQISSSDRPNTLLLKMSNTSQSFSSG